MGLSTGAILALTGLGGAGITAGAGLAAAGEQAGAAQSAAQLEAQEQQQALQFEEQVYGNQQSELAPYLQAGGQGLTSLESLLAPGGQLTQQFGQFQAPTLQQAEQQPGYQFSLQQGENALQQSAAAQGNLLSAGTLKGLTQYGQNAAQTDYQNVYNNALNSYLTNFNTFNTNQQNLYNRYAGLAGIGQQAASTAGSLAGQSAGTVGNTLLTGGAQQAQTLQNAAYQTGSGYTAAGNALGGGLSNLGGLLSLSSLLGGSQNSLTANTAQAAGNAGLTNLASVGAVP